MLPIKRTIICCFSAIFILLFINCIAIAEDFSGTWYGKYFVKNAGPYTTNFVLSQSGSTITGSYTTSSGLTGTISGSALDNTISFSIEEPGVCEGVISGTGILHGEVLILSINKTNCPELMTFSGAATRNHVDTNRWVNAIKRKYVAHNNFIEGEIWSHVDDPQSPVVKTIKSARFITPLGEIIPMELDNEDGRWEADRECGQASLLSSRFPDGVYGFDMIFEDNTKGAEFVTLSGDYPDEYPIITYPSNNSVIDETADLNITWNPASSSVTGLYYSTEDSDSADLSGHLPSTATGVTIPANTYSNSSRCAFHISFDRHKPVSRCNKIKSTEIEFYTDINFAEHHQLLLLKSKSPNGEISGVLTAEIYGNNIKSVTISKDSGGENIALIQDSNKNKWGIVVIDTLPNIISRFPDGNYIFEVIFNDDSTITRSVTMDDDFPVAYPLFHSPEHGQTLSRKSNFKIFWDMYADNDSQGRYIMLQVDEIDSINSLLGTNDQGNDINGTFVMNNFFLPETTEVTLTPGMLPSKGALRIMLIFINFGSDYSGKGSLSWINIKAGNANTVPLLLLLN